jgi:hypothetical protein
LVPTGALRIVVANAGPADRLAARTAETLRTFGYVDIAVTTATTRRPTTAVLFVPGREGEARVLAAQLGVAEDAVQPRPDGQLTVNDAQGDVWVLVGADRVPLIEQAQQG